MAESAKLSKPIVDAAGPDAAEYTLWDSEVPGFGLRVRPSGAKSFVLMYRAGGRLRKLTVGQYGSRRRCPQGSQEGSDQAANRIAGEIAADLAGKPPAKVAKLTTKKGSR